MSTAKPFDPSIYVITDSRLSRGRSAHEVVREATSGGATCIQLREKELTTREYYDLALRIRELTLAEGITFIVNDHLDVALAVEADGVHLGTDDLPAGAARSIIPPSMVLGVTARSLEHALEYEQAGATYLGVGAVYATGTKGNTGTPIGLDGLAGICREIKIPVVGIGGIDASRAGAVIEAGASGVAVVSAVVSAPDIAAATRELVSVVKKAQLQQRS